MPIEITEINSPGWWFNRLAKQLWEVRPHYDLLESYYNNSNPVPHMGKDDRVIREAYQRLLDMSRMNFAELVVEAVRERMYPNGFLMNGGKDTQGAKKAWRYWQDNQLDADNMLVHRAMLSMGRSYVIVGRSDDGPLITAEDPREVITAFDPIRKRKTIAALKMFRDTNTDYDQAYVYLQDGKVYHAQALIRRSEENEVFNRYDPNWSVDTAGFDWVEVIDTKIPGVVPVVQFVNNANVFGKGWGEYERHLSVLNRINYTILTRLEVATMQAFKQRGIKGVPDADEKGDPIDYSDVFTTGPGHMWLLPETAEIWESGAVDLTPIRSAVRDDVQDLAASTRTPLFYLTPEANNGSAEGASLARESLIFKTQDRITQTSEGWEQVIGLSFLFDGDTRRAKAKDTEVLWNDPERHSLSEKYDAAAKAGAAGVPWETVMSQVLQFTPQEIERMASQRASDALLAASLAPQVPPSPTAPAGRETALQPAPEDEEV